MLESIFNETVAISTAQHQICLIALPPDFQVGQARPLTITQQFPVKGTYEHVHN